MKTKNLLKKAFLLLALMGGATSAWADTAILSWNMGTNGADASSANSITGASGCAAVGFTIAITGNTGKNWTSGNGSVTYNTVSYKTLKNSNGAQNTITCPSGKVATHIDFYAVTNHESTKGKLSEIDGTSCSDDVNSLQDYSNPTVISKDIDNKASFTFTFSTKQVCFIAVVTYTDAAEDVVAEPSILLDGSSLTMPCVTVGATVHYTLDGSEPTASSPSYSSAITLDNSCTVRAKAFKGANNEYSSEIVKRECYVSHASVDGYITALGYNGGTVDGDVWTAPDFSITNNVEGRGINYANLAGAQDGFKLNHTDSYTIQPSEDVKVTKIVVVGKSWLQGDAGNAATIAFDGFAPASGTFFDYLTDDETYVKTVEFTPSTEQTYGQSITMRPGNNQLGAYIEVYGTKRSVPADGKYNIAATWDFSTSAAQSASGTIGTSGSYPLKATNGKSIITYVGGSSDTYDSSNGYLKHGGASSATRYFILPITSNGTLGVTTKTNNGTFTIKKAANTTTTWKDATEFDPAVTITTTADGTEVTGEITYDANNPYLIIGFSSKLYTQKITWTPSVESVTLTTSANMAGWRAFYDASNGYTLDANTKAYIATDVNDGVVKMKPINDVPSGTPVILKTTSSADNYKMTLTKASLEPYEDLGNLLSWTTDAVDSKYRLGYGDEGVGFYPYSGTPSSGAVILNVPSNQARSLRIVFGGEITDINEVKTEVKAAKEGKFIENGKLVIFKNGKKFNAAGAKLY